MVHQIVAYYILEDLVFAYLHEIPLYIGWNVPIKKQEPCNGLVLEYTPRNILYVLESTELPPKRRRYLEKRFARYAHGEVAKSELERWKAYQTSDKCLIRT